MINVNTKKQRRNFNESIIFHIQDKDVYILNDVSDWENEDFLIHLADVFTNTINNLKNIPENNSITITYNDEPVLSQKDTFLIWAEIMNPDIFVFKNNIEIGEVMAAIIVYYQLFVKEIYDNSDNAIFKKRWAFLMQYIFNYLNSQDDEPFSPLFKSEFVESLFLDGLYAIKIEDENDLKTLKSKFSKVDYEFKPHNTLMNYNEYPLFAMVMYDNDLIELYNEIEYDILLKVDGYMTVKQLFGE